MRRPWWLGILLIGLIAAVPALCAVGNDPKENASLLENWRTKDKALRRLWVAASIEEQTWKKEPKVLEDFPQEVQDFVKKTRWTSSELSKLRLAHGRWPNYAETIYQLHKEHAGLPPLPKNRVE